MEMNLSLLVKPEYVLAFWSWFKLLYPVNLRLGANPWRHIIPFCFLNIFMVY